MTRIGLIGGMSWESTASYYRLLNEATSQQMGPWHQPSVLIDSLDFSQIVELQRGGDWSATGRLLADSARRLAAGGAEVLAICANTMHINLRDVEEAVSVPVVDIRDAIVQVVAALGASSVSLLGTKYLMNDDFYSSHLERAGVRVIKPREGQVEELQAIIYDELTRGVVTESSRARFLEIADDCRSRGGEVVGLCCTEFGLLLDESRAPWPFVDSTAAHVNALLSA
jgi:aspartate racemase